MTMMFASMFITVSIRYKDGANGSCVVLTRAAAGVEAVAGHSSNGVAVAKAV